MPPDDSTPSAAQAFIHASLRGQETGRIRRLKGFLKGPHFEPDAHSPAAESFVRKAGTPDIDERAENLFRQLRADFGYKRKELVYSCDAGSAAIRGPDFEVSMVVDQDPRDVRSYRIELVVSGFMRPEVVTEPAFIDCFQLRCDTVLIECANAIDIEAKIDALEETDLADLLDYPADASWLSVKVPGAQVQMLMRPHEISFTIPPGGDLRQLIEGSVKLLNEFNDAGLGSFLG